MSQISSTAPITDSIESAADASRPVDPGSMWNRGFVALLITQFLVTLNDNLFKWFIIPVGAACVGWADRRSLIVGLGSAALLAPFILFASTAGYCTDKFSRRNVMICVKALEIVAILIGVWAILAQSVVGMLIVLTLLGIQGTFFSPCKYGSIPDLVPHEKLTSANGVIALTTMIAAVGGGVLGASMADLTSILNAEKTVETGTGGMVRSWIWISSMLGIAVVGFLSSLFIPKIPAVDPQAKFPYNPVTQTSRDIYALFKIRPLFIAAIASAFFWGLAAIAQANIDKYAIDTLHVMQTYTGCLLAILSFGIGIGSVLAGIWSKRRIELGLVPIGAFGIGICALLLGFTPISDVIGRNASPFSYSFIYAGVTMTLLGIFAGIYDIPMAAYIQDKSPKETRGRILAAVNFFSFSAMFLFSGLLYILLGDVLQFTSTQIWIVLAVIVSIVFVMITIHFLVELITLLANVIFILFYRRQVVGLENIPETGPVLFVGNHVSYLDGFMLQTALTQTPRYVAHAHYLPGRFINYLADRIRIIRILPGKKVIESIKAARAALKNGERLVIFAEGGITRTGSIRHFEPGFLSFLKGSENIPIVPFYIGGLYGSMFSYAHGGGTSLWPKRLKDSVIMAFGKPVHGVRDPQQLQQLVEELGVDTMREYNRKPLPIPQRIAIRKCKSKGRATLVVDSLNVQLSGYKFLAGALIARKLLREHVLGPEDKKVGTLVPMSVGGMITNAAIALDGRAVVNLNLTFTQETLNYCIQKADVRHVLTSRRILERFPDLKLDARIVCMEDLLPKATSFERLRAFLRAILTPAWILERQLGLHRIKPDDDLAVIFTSGSTGTPKGVQLSHKNIGECARSFFDTIGVTQDDTVLGVLPFFHAFGYVGNFWMVMLSGCTGVLHYNPLEAKTVGNLARKYGCTFVPCTPTFLRGYLRRPKEEFENLKTVLTGAEKLPLDLIESWEAKFGVRPSEGYGTTELSPCATVNIPPNRQHGTYHPYLKDGSIGQMLPNIAGKIIDLETGADLPPGQTGMFVVKGPIVMKGYYDEPEKTAEVIKDGWYTTGDVGHRDAEGFIFLTGRQSRISKIGGEMVPHVMIEEKIQQIVKNAVQAGGTTSGEFDETAVNVAVTAVPDPVKGERIIVLHKRLPISPADIRSAMLAEGFPNLWIPHLPGFIKVESIPLLGTGKLDLRAVKQTAEQLNSGELRIEN